MDETIENQTAPVGDERAMKKGNRVWRRAGGDGLFHAGPGKDVTTWFCRAAGFCSEYFIIGDPRKSGGAYVFHRDTQTGKTSHYRQVGVFDDYQRVAQIPKWVRPLLAEILLPNTDPPEEKP